MTLGRKNGRNSKRSAPLRFGKLSRVFCVYVYFYFIFIFFFLARLAAYQSPPPTSSYKHLLPRPKIIQVVRSTIGNVYGGRGPVLTAFSRGLREPHGAPRGPGIRLAN